MEPNEEDPYEIFREIRRSIRRFSSDSVIHNLLVNLRSEKSAQELGGQPPFALLLLLKWTIRWGNEPNVQKRAMGRGDYVDLINLWHNMNGNMVMPNDCSHINVFMRMLAYQQFWLQHPPTISTFSRQFLLFRRPESNHFFNSIFRASYGIELEDFLDLATGLLAFLSEKPKTILSQTWFSTASKRFSTDVISAYFRLISSDFLDHREIFKADDKRPLIEEFYERSPLRLRPFLHDKKTNRYFPTSNSVLGYFLINGTYELLRKPDPDRFMNRFGPIFEEYVARCLQYAGISFEKESEIQSVTGTNENVDFVISGEGAFVFIDAKGVEMRFKGHVSTDSKTISENIRTSVTKGIRQSFSTCFKYKERSRQSRTRESFSIIVTYKELYLGDGITFAESVGTALLEELNGRFPKWARIPPENMFFLDISELERLCEIVRKKHKPIEEILRIAREESKEPTSKKFQFSQHLDGLSENHSGPAFLSEAFETEVQRFQTFLY